MTWKAVARSALGTSHRDKGIPCQDYGAYRSFDDGNIIVGAVADGAGSAKYADVGAKLAVRGALLCTQKWFEWLGRQKVSLRSLSKQAITKHLNKTLEIVAKILEKQAIARDHSVHDFNCTLLLFIATPEWVAAAQVGDGFIVVKPVGQDYQLVFQPDKGEFINQTTFVTSPDCLTEMKTEVFLNQYEFICASTDGLERLAIQTFDWKPGNGFFQPLQEYMQTTAYPEVSDEYIVSFLNSERLNARTDDDKTLLLCLYHRYPYLPMKGYR
ncbi:protein phosphatase 2C domain-containing protein [Trichocoleus desertorum AS-A10]|uniref:PP2C family serine/threonine-protein phosphatase n=1 Tax=Trichocoleus desertorum TaxID=1481672 RepID=UPI00329907E3